MQCDECGKRFLGSGLSLTLEGKQKTLCADCYGKTREVYDRKKNCDDCRHFDEECCELTGNKLEKNSIGYKDYFVQAEKCAHYTVEEVESEENTTENLEKTGHTRPREKETTVSHTDVKNLVRQLADRGKTLTYYCCHCGASLRVGAESTEVFEICPSCGYSLEALDLAKLISQHQPQNRKR
jgi:hypothetical protein